MNPAVAAVCLAFALAAGPPQQARAADTARSRKEIEAVIETFRTAILEKDKAAFMKLFLKEDITWASVLSDTSAEMLYASRPKPELPHPSKVSARGSPAGFIDFVVQNPARLEETFSKVRIDTDGEVAQVWFDYTFTVGTYKQNWGKEGWQLLRTESGWKIASVVWSQELNPAPPPRP
ncbi:nuclear transport factor 2 family protein [Aggregicoccus sp. 17bor-14]|uniref:hypothetical protein n=1 Tax=Myxococcaceae TaxID=31 RepID=UPI00129CAB2C|nr:MULTISPECIES: hypothetical protein [Myxococcaceae]MBF5041988.1 hypothetical protein [Simulacricoccus sp. 17bor-14]MRI87768.1 nuclear transport factor 2 family protein [Aggregicoccus sp. 17bor-14]